MAKIANASQLLNALTDGSIANLDALISRRTGNPVAPESFWQHKESRVAGAGAQALVVGTWTSLWQFEGQPSHGAVPTTWVNPTNVTAGSLMQTDPGGGRAKLLTYLSGVAGPSGILLLYDRLGHIGGLDATLATAQNINGGSPATLTRYTSGERNMIWAEIYTAVGTTVRNLAPTYTNQAGTSGQVGVGGTLGSTNSNEAQRLVPLSLAQGDYGVQSITSVTLTGTTGTAGNFGITIARPLAYLCWSVSLGATQVSWVDGPLAKIQPGACLALALMTQAANTTIYDCFYEMVES